MKESGKQEGVVGQLAVSTPLDIVVPIYRNAAMTRECLVSIVENLGGSRAAEFEALEADRSHSSRMRALFTR
jgi:hypothetical protein